ncbi:hypothetical protein N183_35730 [Sinorhizobium sp. Sb3]|uniref:hypothetical protein n=1 Tax=Sinorhizobium sp. Sb3 TaxID=1358417 RepID=UPI00071E2E0B|nr:hypothetical protein [Sinorhizobium sp. Sb3]KSV63404.1 hypothetical protein N183_35730 [Sinorhizobium sp. Sb3]
MTDPNAWQAAKVNGLQRTEKAPLTIDWPAITIAIAARTSRGSLSSSLTASRIFRPGRFRKSRPMQEFETNVGFTDLPCREISHSVISVRRWIRPAPKIHLIRNGRDQDGTQ